MPDQPIILNKISALKIVLLYAVVSATYIYTSDAFLDLFVDNVGALSKLQTYKGLGFILVTSILLYFLVKRNGNILAHYYKQIIEVQNSSDEHLKELNKDYLALFDHSPLPMLLFDPETLDVLHVNNATCSTYGFTHEECATMTIRDFRPNEDVPIFENLFSASKNSDEYTFPDLFRHKKKNGEIIHVKIRNTTLTYSGKKVRLASAVDVTAEVKIQEQLLDSNARLQRACEVAGMGYWTNDLINHKMRWSEELYKMFECDPNTFELSLESISNMFHPEDRKHFNPEKFTQLEENKVNESEHRIISGSGRLKWILERLYLTKDASGKPIRLEGIAVDITDRKLYEQEILESNKRFRILSDATVEAIIDWDLKTDAVMWGEGFHTMFGYELHSCNKKLWLDNIHPEDRARVLRELTSAIKDSSKAKFDSEFRFLKADGSVAFVQHKGVFIRDAKGYVTRALGAMIDETETLQRIHKIERQNEALRDIAWTQSHVVRAPLANLMGLASLLKHNQTRTSDDAELVEHLCDSAQKLDHIIHQIVEKIEVLDKGTEVSHAVIGVPY